jgi:hypothetical protein
MEFVYLLTSLQDKDPVKLNFLIRKKKGSKRRTGFRPTANSPSQSSLHSFFTIYVAPRAAHSLTDV